MQFLVFLCINMHFTMHISLFPAYFILLFRFPASLLTARRENFYTSFPRFFLFSIRERNSFLFFSPVIDIKGQYVILKSESFLI